MKNKKTGSIVSYEEGLFSRERSYTARLVCDTHGDEWPFILETEPKTRINRAMTKPWLWCQGCAVIANGVSEYPSWWCVVWFPKNKRR